VSRRVNYYNTVKRDGVSITDTTNLITYIKDTSIDNLSFTQQYFIVEANAAFADVNVTLRDDALFTYFFEEGADVLSEVKVKLNGGDTVFNVAPDLWIEEPIDQVEVQNLTSQRKLVYVYQVYAQGVC